MSRKLTDDELIAERERADALADLCFLHGFSQAGQHHRFTRDAISTEMAARQRNAGQT